MKGVSRIELAAVWLLSLAGVVGCSAGPDGGTSPGSLMMSNSYSVSITAQEVICGGAQLPGQPTCRPGQALAGASVQISQSGANVASVTTGSDGTASVTLPNGQYQASLTCSSAGDQCNPVSFAVSGSDTQVMVEQQLDAP